MEADLRREQKRTERLQRKVGVKDTRWSERNERKEIAKEEREEKKEREQELLHPPPLETERTPLRSDSAELVG